MSCTKASDLARRRLVARLLTGALIAPLALLRSRHAQAADLPLVDPASPTAQKLHYTTDASKAKAAAGNRCANCGLYQGTNGSKQGPCQLFPGKDVLAGGWCSSWEPQM